MNAIPQFKADPEEYPELSKIVNSVIRSVVEIMEVHDIGTVRRFRKEGVFDRPYTKDIVTPLGVPGVPKTVASTRDATGTAILEYLETVGVIGLAISATDEEKQAISLLWSSSQQSQPVKPKDQPKAPVMTGEVPQGAGARPDAGTEDKPEKKSTKEKKNGRKNAD